MRMKLNGRFHEHGWVGGVYRLQHRQTGMAGLCGVVHKETLVLQTLANVAGRRQTLETLEMGDKAMGSKVLAYSWPCTAAAVLRERLNCNDRENSKT